jgi:hypothetical protein
MDFLRPIKYIKSKITIATLFTRVQFEISVFDVTNACQ